MNDDNEKQPQGETEHRETLRWQDELTDRLRIKLDALEDYEERSVDNDYYEFYRFMDNCQSVYSVDSLNQRFILKRKSSRRLFGNAGAVDTAITQGIAEKGLDPQEVPLIPILEYKLVPTGNIEYYDATLTRDARRNRRYRSNPAGRFD